MQKRFTGWHMLATMVAFFGVIIAVNLNMARIAIGTFGGVVVENSYVASQEFNDWLNQVEAQEQLGWEVATGLRDDRRIVISVANAPDALAVTAIARHPLGQEEDRPIQFERLDSGEYASAQPLPDGRWILRLQLRSGTDKWRSEEELR